jgi:mannosyltransferase
MFMVAHAQNARAYSLALLMVTLATLFFFDAVQSRRPVAFFAYGALSTLALYLSPLSGLVLIAQLVSLLLLPRARTLLRPLAITFGGILLAALPLAALMLSAGGDQVDYLERPGIDRALDVASEMLGMWNVPLVVVWAALILAGLLSLWGIGPRAGNAPGKGEAGDEWAWRRALVVSWALLPPLLLFVYSQLDPLFAGRYLLASAPALAIIAAFAVVSISRRSRPLAALVILLLIGVTLPARIGLETYGDAYRQGWAEGDRTAAQLIVERGKPGDGIVFHPWGQRLTIDMHFTREAPAGADLPDDFAIEQDAQELDDLYAKQLPPQAIVERLRQYPRVWLLSWDTPEGELTTGIGRGVLRSDYRRVLVRDYGQLRVGLYEQVAEPLR